ncbi:MAG: class I SAM-dependent methyltransferase [Candidatus Micrarchaeota archaeon]
MDAFDKIAHEWNAWRQSPISCLQLFLPLVLQGDAILDAGCGNGRNLSELAKSAKEAYGVDSSTEMLKFARENILKKGIKNAAVVDGNILHLPFANAFFEKIFCAAVVHHLKKEEQMVAVSEFCRVLRPGGAIFATVWAENKLRRGNEGHVKWGEVQRYHYFFTKEELKALFEEGGFNVQDVFFEKDGKRVGKEKAQNLILVARK